MKIGDKLPQFTLPNHEGVMVDSSNYIYNPVVIYFYPKNETKGCTSQACSFRDHYEEFTDKGVFVFGISSDSVESHANFKKHHRLPFTLLSDAENKVRKMFGVKANALGLIPGRETFVFDDNGILVHKFVSQLNFNKHITEALNAINKMKI